MFHYLFYRTKHRIGPPLSRFTAVTQLGLGLIEFPMDGRDVFFYIAVVHCSAVIRLGAVRGSSIV